MFRDAATATSPWNWNTLQPPCLLLLCSSYDFQLQFAEQSDTALMYWQCRCKERKVLLLLGPWGRSGNGNGGSLLGGRMREAQEQ